MDDHRLCRLSIGDGELTLMGPPSALRALGRLLQQHAEPIEVAVDGGVVAQEMTVGPLLVSLHGETTLHLSGSPQNLGIVWHALEGVAADAETAEDQAVNRHAHIEHLHEDDDYRSPESIPLVIGADWPEPL